MSPPYHRIQRSVWQEQQAEMNKQFRMANSRSAQACFFGILDPCKGSWVVFLQLESFKLEENRPSLMDLLYPRDLGRKIEI